MRSDDVIDIDAGPRVKQMYRLMVEYLAQAEGVPMMTIYQRGLDLILADYEWTVKDLKDYYGRRAVDLDRAMSEARRHGITARKAAKEARDRDSKVRRAA